VVAWTDRPPRGDLRIEPRRTPHRRRREALGAVPGATTVDAFVMADAALRGDVVLTADPKDLEKLRPAFPGVSLLAKWDRSLSSAFRKRARPGRNPGSPWPSRARPA